MKCPVQELIEPGTTAMKGACSHHSATLPLCRVMIIIVNDNDNLLFCLGVREVAEFGPMAGLCGCALAVALWCHQQLK